MVGTKKDGIPLSASGKKIKSAYYDEMLRTTIEPHRSGLEVSYLRYRVKFESTHWQWVRQLFCLILLTALILLNLFMGTKSNESIIGWKRCSGAYWAAFFVFLCVCALILFLGIRLAKHDQKLKLSYGGVNVVDSDIRYEDNKSLGMLCLLGFAGGWVAGALGLGGGSIYNPALLSLGIPPKVASATGLYLVTYSKIASVLVYYLNDQLDIPYGMWIGAWSCVGMVIGLLITNFYMKRTGRQSVIVWCLVVIFAVSVIAIPIFGGLSLKEEADEGKNLMEFESLCAAKEDE